MRSIESSRAAWVADALSFVVSDETYELLNIGLEAEFLELRKGEFDFAGKFIMLTGTVTPLVLLGEETLSLL